MLCLFSDVWGNKQDEHGAYLIDRSPEYFEPILNYLRHGQLIINEGINIRGNLSSFSFFFLLLKMLFLNDEVYLHASDLMSKMFKKDGGIQQSPECFPGVLEEARFFGIEQLAEQLEVAIKVVFNAEVKKLVYNKITFYAVKNVNKNKLK